MRNGLRLRITHIQGLRGAWKVGKPSVRDIAADRRALHHADTAQVLN